MSSPYLVKKKLSDTQIALRKGMIQQAFEDLDQTYDMTVHLNSVTGKVKGTVGIGRAAVIPKPALPFFTQSWVGHLQKTHDSLQWKQNGNVMGFERSVVCTRNKMKYTLWMMAHNLEQRWAEHPGMREEEQEKIEQVLDILSDLLDRETWNENTLYFKTNEKS